MITTHQVRQAGPSNRGFLPTMGTVIKFLIPAVAVVLLAFAIVHVARSGTEQPLADPYLPPPQPPDEAVLSGQGVVEARGGNVAVAAAVPGVVSEAYVKVGQRVAAGKPLLRLNDSSQIAALRLCKAQLETARTRLARLEGPPRRDDLVVAASRVRAARADVAAKRAAHQHTEKLHSRSLIGELEVEQHKQAVIAAESQAEAAEAAERLLRAGAPDADRATARAQVAEAEALVGQAEAALGLLTTRAPAEGTVLQLNIRPGEAVGTRPDLSPLVLGDVQVLHLRVELEEHLLGRFRPGAPGRAVRRGEGGAAIPITFVRVEPLVVVKRVLGGFPGEQSDARVLQVIYQLPEGEAAVHVGQRFDVFLAADQSR